MGRKTEQRALRSEDTRTAISYQLAYSAVQAGMEGLVLADQNGLLLGASPSTHSADEIAAFSPISLDPDRALQGALADREDLSIQSFECDGCRLFLVALGGMASHRAVALTRAMRGVARILRTTVSMPAPTATCPA